MKVKRLEIQGFKSFKDKTLIHFDHGVTGIIGPNGCGKSNIVDAFFWVMGEQSIKHMRADGQLDLIFNGSEKHAPLNMAEVTMVLATGAGQEKSESRQPGDSDGVPVREPHAVRLSDEPHAMRLSDEPHAMRLSDEPHAMRLSDEPHAMRLPAHLKYDEISITRRLFRDGESAYLINGQPCRLKDIHELFMDTGAGPKAYSIIEQGQIAKIIQSKPEDRRVLVEEAAGIVKFKARKKESQRKIEATQANLLRINDIISEIERNLNLLEKQAHKARQYKGWKEELRNSEMLVGRKKLFGLKTRSVESETQVKELEISEIEKRNSFQTAELRIENHKIQIAEAQRLIEDGQLTLENMQREISGQDTSRQLEKRHLEELENSNMTFEDELCELERSIQMCSEEKTKHEQEKTQLEEQVALTDQTLKEQQARLESAKRTALELGLAVEQEKRDLLASFARKNEISNQVHGLEARVDTLSIQLNGLSAKISDRQVEVEMCSQKHLISKNAYESALKLAGIAQIKEETLRTDVGTLEAGIKILRRDEHQAYEALMKSEIKVKALSDLIENLDGMQSDVRSILQDVTLSAGLGGIFADKVCAHPGFELSLEAVLCDILESFIVENNESAKNTLMALKERNMGRATFLALDLLEKSASHLTTHAPCGGLTATGSLREKVHALVPQAKALKDVIGFDHSVNPAEASLFLLLFDCFFVVENFEAALEAFNKTAGLGAGFVTRDGDVIDRFGRITGGCTKALEGGLLSRKAELQKLKEAIVGLSASAIDLKTRLSDVENALTQRKNEFEYASAELKSFDLQAKSTERDFVSAQSHLSMAGAELEKLNGEREMLDAERKSLWEKLDGIRIELSSLEGTMSTRETQIQARETAYREFSEKTFEIQAEILQFKTEASVAHEKSRHATQNLERVGNMLSQDLARKEEVESMINRKLDEKDIVAAVLAKLEESLSELTTKALAIQEKISGYKNGYEILQAGLNATFDDQRTSMHELEEVTGKLSRTKLDLERFTLEYNMLYQNMFQRYGIEENAIAPLDEDEKCIFEKLTDEKAADLQVEVDKLHERIRKLGEVNVMAVEEYDEQKKRHDFLLTQREDLNQAIADLGRAIERINMTSQTRFKIAFDEINKRFERIYPIVFGGGWGKLVLTSPNDMNETGVDIIAEPPGKKVSSIQLMSGGEKALTAVALIFSIFLIKPSPFCILDEVDAPLDDHNVGKFNTLLKEMALRSQFIIITHNKRTMELNDKLYGVTMEEPGVSKMVSIQIQ